MVRHVATQSEKSALLTGSCLIGGSVPSLSRPADRHLVERSRDGAVYPVTRPGHRRRCDPPRHGVCCHERFGAVRPYRNWRINFLARIIKQGYPTTPHFTSMRRKTANIDIRVEPQLVEKIDTWRARQRVPPSRTAAIVHMLEDFLDHDLPGSNAAWKRLLSKA